MRLFKSLHQLAEQWNVAVDHASKLHWQHHKWAMPGLPISFQGKLWGIWITSQEEIQLHGLRTLSARTHA